MDELEEWLDKQEEKEYVPRKWCTAVWVTSTYWKYRCMETEGHYPETPHYNIRVGRWRTIEPSSIAVNPTLGEPYV